MIYHDTRPWQADAFSLFALFKDQPYAFFLDSSMKRSRARFSYIGFSPFTIVATRQLSDLKRVFDRYRLLEKESPLSFPAGAVGYLGYDGGVFFGFYDTILRVDKNKKQVTISSFSKARLKDAARQLKQPPTSSFACQRFKGLLHFKSNFTKIQYTQAVRKALEYIRRGDIYQINLSHRMRVAIPDWRRYASPIDIYGSLRTLFPSEFGAYFDDGSQIVLSASPERFLRLYKGLAEIRPMKGTRPRGETPAQDRMFKKQLRHSSKEIAELLMITDLERNDLGRVCDYKSVRVKAMRTIETYKSVFQATSTVQGRLRHGYDGFDLLKAAFPSGSVTGTPKIAAMNIIKKLERSSRGLYTGALGYMSFSKDMDFNVMIRTMFLRRDNITFHVGGGIVADSNPEAEWQETLWKAKPLMETLERSFV